MNVYYPQLINKHNLRPAHKRPHDGNGRHVGRSWRLHVSAAWPNFLLYPYLPRIYVGLHTRALLGG